MMSGIAFWYIPPDGEVVTAPEPEYELVAAGGNLLTYAGINDDFHVYQYNNTDQQYGCQLRLISALNFATDVFEWNIGSEDPGGGTQSIISGYLDSPSSDPEPPNVSVDFFGDQVNDSTVEIHPTLNSSPYGLPIRIEAMIF